MKINGDSKDKVAVDDVTLWANRFMKCHGNTISRRPVHIGLVHRLYLVALDGDFTTGTRHSHHHDIPVLYLLISVQHYS